MVTLILLGYTKGSIRIKVASVAQGPQVQNGFAALALALKVLLQQFAHPFPANLLKFAFNLITMAHCVDPLARKAPDNLLKLLPRQQRGKERNNSPKLRRNWVRLQGTKTSKMGELFLSRALTPTFHNSVIALWTSAYMFPCDGPRRYRTTWKNERFV
ncbi:MAG: hypothetical protein HKP58_01525 [Desulfatitalea sp.]|nr:hypothetical protein [Desulfatitalea sp.]NNJ99067.1 hypothetical protein [Desulfatitalea sp.]